MIIVSAVCAGLVIGLREGGADSVGAQVRRKPTQAISRTCSKTRFPSLCVNSLLEFPGSLTTNEQDLVHISFNMMLQHFSKALYTATSAKLFPEPRELVTMKIEEAREKVETMTMVL
ncbi:hypothetical protein V6N13_017582 [Hibiscus sabdariffa]|uniref:Pectinesterase inhibitor domain-containing protein n=2 Tax=Hibiscus sabdariffa TaxID=183260 RepID=A0ABR2AHA6_9ROSI